MIARIARAAGIAAGALLLATACGGDEVGIFDEKIDDVRAAVEAGDRQAAAAAIDDLAVLALGAHEEGEVDDAELQELAALIDRARGQLDEELPEPTTTTQPTTTTTEPAPAVEIDSDHDDGGDDRGKGKGKKGKDDDDD